MAQSSTPTSPFKADSYHSDIVTGAHGDKYQKDLALIMFERATREGYDFRLGYEMAIADKFDDVAFFNSTNNECILIQTKHADTSKGKPAPLKFDMLFPRDEPTREKGDFSLFKYLKSYKSVQVNIRERKSVVIFTNRDLLRNSLEHSAVEVADRQVDEILRFDNASHVRLKVKNQLIKELLDYVNRDFISLRNSIVKLFEEEAMDQTIKNFKTPLAGILTETNGIVSFSENGLSGAVQLLESLRDAMDIRTARLPLGKCKDLFAGKSRNKTLPVFATEDLVCQFFEDLVLSIRQPDDLGSIIDQDLRLWMRTWILPDYLTRLEEPQLKAIACSLQEFFNIQQSQEVRTDAGKSSKKFLQLKDGEEFFRSTSCYLTKQFNNLSNYNSDNASKYYVNRSIKYKVKSSLNNYDIGDHVSDSARDTGIKMLPPMARDRNCVSERDMYHETRISDENFAKELVGKFDNQNFFLLTAEPGMGKSTILQFIALTAQKNSDVCVYIFYLNKFHQQLEDIKENHSFDQLLAILKTALSETLFKNLQSTFEHKNDERKHLMIFDALDEVAPHNRKKALNMFKGMLAVPDVKILVSARKNLEKLVEEEFTVKAMGLEPFSCQDQTNFLRKFWEVPAENEISFLKYLIHLLNEFHSGFNHALSEFTGFPLMLKMLAEVYTDHFNEYSNSKLNDFEQLMPKGKCSIVNLYEQFVRKCFTSKMTKKLGILYSNIDEEHESLFETFILEHQLLAIKQIQIKVLKTDRKYSKVLENFEQRISDGTEKSSLIESVNDDKRFIHRSHSEFLVAKFLLNSIEIHNADIFGTDSRATFLHEYPMIRIFFFAMVEEQFDDQHLDILESHYKNNNDIAIWACEVHGEKTVDFLLRSKCDSSIIDRLLYVAAEHNCYNLCKYLLENHQAKVDSKVNNSAPLHVAAKKGHANIIKLLIVWSSNLNVIDSKGQTPLHIAASNGHLEVAKILIDASADVNAKDTKGCTPLRFAAFNSHLEVVKMLIDMSANINAKDEDDMTPLHDAAAFGHSEVVKILTDKSADINAKTKDGWTPLHLTAVNGHLEVAKILIDNKGADINAEAKYGWTPLHIASKSAHLQFVEMLIDLSANINAKDEDDVTPLHDAAAFGRSEVVKLLTDKSADINAKDKHGWTPLHDAAKKGHLKVAKILIRNAADINAKTKDGCTPLNIASLKGHLEFVKLLEKQ